MRVSNSFGSGWICSRATRIRQCQASTLGMGGGEWGGRHPDAKGKGTLMIKGALMQKAVLDVCKVVALAEEQLAHTFPVNIVLDYRVKPTGMEIKQRCRFPFPHLHLPFSHPLPLLDRVIPILTNLRKMANALVSDHWVASSLCY